MKPQIVTMTDSLASLFTLTRYREQIPQIINEESCKKCGCRVMKIGSKDRPASPEDIADMQKQLESIAHDPDLTIVTRGFCDCECHDEFHNRSL